MHPHTFLRTQISYESGIKVKEAQCLYSLPKKDRNCSRRTGDTLLRAEKYGDLITTKSERRYFSSIATNRIV